MTFFDSKMNKTLISSWHLSNETVVNEFTPKNRTLTDKAIHLQLLPLQFLLLPEYLLELLLKLLLYLLLLRLQRIRELIKTWGCHGTAYQLENRK